MTEEQKYWMDVAQELCDCVEYTDLPTKEIGSRITSAYASMIMRYTERLVNINSNKVSREEFKKRYIQISENVMNFCEENEDYETSEVCLRLVKFIGKNKK